jgi:hypothetical protein
MLSIETISENSTKIHEYIKQYISEPRQSKLLEFYHKFDERLTMMPASSRKEAHSCWPGGYYSHVLKVIECALKLHFLWKEMGCDTSGYTVEELVFSALNHDLGKMGDEEHEAYIPQTDNWRKEKLGEEYMFNKQLEFASVPDRSLFLLQSNGINYSFNEMIAIQIHDGLYDDANKKYLMTFAPEQKPRTALPYIIHQADMIAARVEFELFWNPILNSDTTIVIKKQPKQQKSLGNIKSTSLQTMLNNI